MFKGIVYDDSINKCYIKKIMEVDLPTRVLEVRIKNGTILLNKNDPKACIRRKVDLLTNGELYKLNKMIDIFIDSE